MKSILFIACTCLATIGFAQTKAPAKPAPKAAAKPTAQKVQPPASAPLLKSFKDSGSYGLGFKVAENLSSQQLDQLNLDLFQRGMKDYFEKKKGLLTDEQADIAISEMMRRNQASVADRNKAAGKAFREELAKKQGVKSLPNGILYEVITQGTDTSKPTLTSRVRCHYKGTLINGQVFDSSVDRGEPATFPVNGVIRGWQEVLPLMTVGSKWRVVIPSELAYGDGQAGALIAPGSTLVFEIELLGIEN